MSPNRNPQEFLIILSPEERAAADAFLARRLQLISTDRLSDVDDLLHTARDAVNQMQAEAGRLDTSTRIGAIRSKVYQSAIQGARHLVTECAAAASRIRPERPPGEESDGSEEPDAAGPPGMTITADDTEIEHATEVIDSALADMPLEDLRLLRDACSELLTWWSSDQGQAESLHLDQYGEIGTAKGRTEIRKARENLKHGVLDPMRGFFQELNLAYQRRSQESLVPPPLGDMSANLDS